MDLLLVYLKIVMLGHPVLPMEYTVGQDTIIPGFGLIQLMTSFSSG